MTETATIEIQSENLQQTLKHEGTIALFVDTAGELFPASEPVDDACNGAITRAAESEDFKKLEPGECLCVNFPSGLEAKKIVVVKIDQSPTSEVARKAGGAIAAAASKNDTLVLSQNLVNLDHLMLGTDLRAYRFDKHKTEEKEKKPVGQFVFCVNDPDGAEANYSSSRAVVAGTHLTRDLVNEPSNVLTTEEFVARLLSLREDGVEVTILEDSELEEIGMRALLAVGQGSSSRSFVGVLKWLGGKDDPLVVAGKGVVFDTGGISLKPAAKMEKMTMDMAGAATVAGVMRSVARRKAKANVIGIVGLVENMPDGNAQRPGDVVRSLKGDTIEVINTDAEGRLVLADILRYAQKEFNPAGLIDLATLTGAIIVSLGNEFAGGFSNNDEFFGKFSKAAESVGEKVWRMPLDKAYDELLKSKIADMKNVGGREAGAITAAQFIQRFVEPTMPWIHLDIAGVASKEKKSDLAPAGGTGWGVQSLDSLIRREFEER